jgi:hypothetical protein
MSAADRRRAAAAANVCRYGDNRGSVATLRYGHLDNALNPPPPAPVEETYLSAMAAIYSACARMLKPGGYLVLITKNLRADGTLRNIAGDAIALCQRSGLLFQQHIVALLAAIRDDDLFARPSYFQMTNVRHALARGERQRLVCHEDVLAFQRDPTR